MSSLWGILGFEVPDVYMGILGSKLGLKAYLRSITLKDLSKTVAVLKEGCEISTAWGTAISRNLSLLVE